MTTSRVFTCVHTWPLARIAVNIRWPAVNTGPRFDCPKISGIAVKCIEVYILYYAVIHEKEGFVSTLRYTDERPALIFKEIILTWFFFNPFPTEFLRCPLWQPTMTSLNLKKKSLLCKLIGYWWFVIFFMTWKKLPSLK